jgi:hypothetical protein
MNAENVAVQERGRPVDDKPRKESIVVWQPKRMSSPSIYVSGFVADH